MTEQIANNIKKYREAANLSQQALAERISISRQAVSNWERGVAMPDIDMIISIASVLKIDITELIYGCQTVDEFQAAKPKRIKIAVILGVIFLALLSLSVFLVPYLYDNRMYRMTVFVICHITILPAAYTAGMAFIMSLIAIWFDFRIKSRKIRLCMLFLSFSFVILELFFMIFESISYYIGISLSDIVHSASIYDWLFSHPVIFIFPGTLLFCGFNKQPTPDPAPQFPSKKRC